MLARSKINQLNDYLPMLKGVMYINDLANFVKFKNRYRKITF